MKVVIDIDENVYTRLFDNGRPMDIADGIVMEKAIRNGTPISTFLEELKRKILMEVDGGTDDRYLRYVDICDRISNSINEYKAESEVQGDEIQGET